MAAEQRIEALAGEDAAHAEKQRTWVRGHYEPDAQHKYETIEGKFRLLQVLLDEGWIEPAETWKLQSLGITFGDILAQGLGLKWILVDDEHGRTPALLVPETTIILYPWTSISKRIERGEPVYVQKLYEQFRETIEDMRRKGY
jgi:hypothetical protein